MLENRTFGSPVDDNDTEEELIRYIYSNHLQSASLELDETGAIISYEEYHPYGTTSYQANNSGIKAVAKRYRYTGEERDEESGLYYHGARYYVPWLCRWTAVGPLESKYGGRSPYSYSANNPVVYNDPDGMEGEKQEQLGFDSGIGTSGNPIQLANVDIVENRDLPWYTSFGFNEYGYYRNEHSEDGFSDPYNYVRFLDNAAGSIWNLGADIFHSFKNFSFEGLKGEVVGYYNYYTQTGISEQWEDTKTSFIAMVSDIRTYENIVPLLLLKRPTTTATVASYEFKNITTVAAKEGTYIPKTPLAQQKVAGWDIPLSDPLAGKFPHTTLGGKIGSDGILYRQSATFTSGSWPLANGKIVPWSRVDWTTHGRPIAHPNPHQHIFNFNNGKNWQYGKAMPFP